MRIAVIYGGTRSNGNTEALTKHAVEGLEVDSIYLNDFHIKSIEDRRHTEGGFSDVGDDYNAVLSRVIQNDIFIFATPIYWYSMSGKMKNFIDRWSQTMKEPQFKGFKESMSKKKAYVIAVGGDSPYIKGLPLIQQFNYIFEFFSLSFEGYIIGKANKPGEIYKDQKAFYEAEQLREILKLQ
ncbi:flavodoxin family protein [Oceanobacillus polygoni]|uniref:Multimeric flavodoxin WrbA n=1 Tax=Oceanobacillus polygoni TaxID=1235259 RepID=A0A9X0YTP1_9BACI|nr:flavodoxin family protein [Oceanobacillus polygoni]MBP2076964.1 multimeric flavodoxin WrbA [Oceanobacillus polygoni]